MRFIQLCQYFTNIIYKYDKMNETLILSWLWHHQSSHIKRQHSTNALGIKRFEFDKKKEKNIEKMWHTYMCVDRFVEVLVLLDELLDVIGGGLVGLVGGGEEGLARRHPPFGLFAVAVEQLEF